MKILLKGRRKKASRQTHIHMRVKSSPNTMDKQIDAGWRCGLVLDRLVPTKATNLIRRLIRQSYTFLMSGLWNWVAYWWSAFYDFLPCVWFLCRGNVHFFKWMISDFTYVGWNLGFIFNSLIDSFHQRSVRIY